MPRTKTGASVKKLRLKTDAQTLKHIFKLRANSDPEVIKLIDLVYQVRDAHNDAERNIAFEQVSRALEPKVKKIAGKFRIPGFTFDDVYQECLSALQFKAIKDYNETRGRDPTRSAPFDQFALLCIRRHLATTLKTSRQNRHIIINRSQSLDQDRSNDNDELSLINIVCASEGDVLTSLQQSEYFKNFVNKLLVKLSPFEKQVFYLYAQQYTYEEISTLINTHRTVSKFRVNVKGVDNALSRIKNKADSLFRRIDPEGWNRVQDAKNKRSGHRKKNRGRPPHCKSKFRNLDLNDNI